MREGERGRGLPDSGEQSKARLLHFFEPPVTTKPDEPLWIGGRCLFFGVEGVR